MPKIYDAIDNFWSYDGDFAISDGGDIMDTSYDMLRSIAQEITTVVQSDKGEWDLQTGIGSNLSAFVGEPNTREAGMAIRDAIIGSLLFNGRIDSSDLDVKVVPINRSTVAIRIVLKYISTVNNSVSKPVTLTFIYDTADNTVYPVNNSYHKDS